MGTCRKNSARCNKNTRSIVENAINQSPPAICPHKSARWQSWNFVVAAAMDEFLADPLHTLLPTRHSPVPARGDIRYFAELHLSAKLFPKPPTAGSQKP